MFSNAGRIVSLGSFCLTRGIIDLCGIDQPSYPFDDTFISIRVAAHCLEDGFETFMDTANFLPADNEKSWVQRRFRDEYHTKNTFAHHDMRVGDNVAKFRRRIDRLMMLPRDERHLFVFMEYADRIGPPEWLDRLAAAVERRFPNAKLLLVAIGDGGVIETAKPNVIARRVHPSSEVHGLHFSDPADNRTMVDLVLEARALCG